MTCLDLSTQKFTAIKPDNYDYFTKLGNVSTILRSLSLFLRHVRVFLQFALVVLPFLCNFAIFLVRWIQAMASVPQDSNVPSSSNTLMPHQDDLNQMDFGYQHAPQDSNVPSSSIMNKQQDDWNQMGVGFLVAMLLSLIPLMFAASTSAGAAIRDTAEIYAGEEPVAFPCLIMGLRLCLRCVAWFLFSGLLGIGAVFVTLLALSLGDGSMRDNEPIVHMALWILFTFWSVGHYFVMLPFQMGPPSLVLEGESVFSTIERTWKLTSGSWLSVCLLVLMLVLFNVVMGFIPVIGVSWHLCSLPLPAILSTVIFLHLRVEKEALDLYRLRSELEFEDDDDHETELVGFDDDHETGLVGFDDDNHETELVQDVSYSTADHGKPLNDVDDVDPLTATAVAKQIV